MTLAESSAQASVPASAAVLADAIDPAEFTAFYESVAPRLWRYLFFAVRNRECADDLLQETFARVLGSRLRPENDEHLRRYLYRTASHLLIDRKRRPSPDHESTEEIELVAAAADPALRLDLSRALTHLKSRDRQVLYLAHVEELDHRGIGAAMGISAMSVRVLLFRARRRLAVVLESESLTLKRSTA